MGFLWPQYKGHGGVACSRGKKMRLKVTRPLAIVGKITMSGMLNSFGLKSHFDEYLLNCVRIAAYHYSLSAKVHVSA